MSGLTEATDAAKTLESELKTLAEDVGNITNDFYDPWDNDEPFVDPRHHLVAAARNSAPNAGDLDAGAVEFGSGTGPNGRDEIFWSVDGNTVARVEADSVIS